MTPPSAYRDDRRLARLVLPPQGVQFRLRDETQPAVLQRAPFVQLASPNQLVNLLARYAQILCRLADRQHLAFLHPPMIPDTLSGLPEL